LLNETFTEGDHIVAELGENETVVFRKKKARELAASKD